jgi:hypothetical protein
MLDIIALFFLCKMNGKLASKKGLKSLHWILYTILAWIVAEIIGMTIGLIALGITLDNILGLMGIGIASAFGGYLIVRAILEKKPDVLDDEINTIGVDDLKPPVK